MNEIFTHLTAKCEEQKIEISIKVCYLIQESVQFGVLCPLLALWAEHWQRRV